MYILAILRHWPSPQHPWKSMKVLRGYLELLNPGKMGLETRMKSLLQILNLSHMLRLHELLDYLKSQTCLVFRKLWFAMITWIWNFESLTKVTDLVTENIFSFLY